MRPREEKRAIALSRLLAGDWTEAETATAVGLSMRQVRRLKKGYAAEGIRSLIHGNRGRPTWNRWDEATRNAVLDLARTTYVGVNDQHLTELLEEREKLQLSRSTVRRILRAGGITSPRKRRSPKHLSRRERVAQEGMLLQIDGSRHDWLEGRGAYLTLIGGSMTPRVRRRTPSFGSRRTLRAISCSYNTSSSTKGCPSRCTGTGTGSSSRRASRSSPSRSSSPRNRYRPSLAASWKSWRSPRSRPGHPKLKDGSNDCGARSRIAW